VTEHPAAAAIVVAARGCVGTRFRLQGRTPGLGLDCIGVVLAAAQGAGVRLADRRDYRLGGDGQGDLDRALAAQLIPVPVPAAGDVLAFAPAAGTRHLGVWTGVTLVHAHAGLRRVVEGPVDPGWRALGAWRLPVAGER